MVAAFCLRISPQKMTRVSRRGEVFRPRAAGAETRRAELLGRRTEVVGERRLGFGERADGFLGRRFGMGID